MTIFLYTLAFLTYMAIAAVFAEAVDESYNTTPRKRTLVALFWPLVLVLAIFVPLVVVIGGLFNREI